MFFEKYPLIRKISGCWRNTCNPNRTIVDLMAKAYLVVVKPWRTHPHVWQQVQENLAAQSWSQAALLQSMTKGAEGKAALLKPSTATETTAPAAAPSRVRAAAKAVHQMQPDPADVCTHIDATARMTEEGTGDESSWETDNVYDENDAGADSEPPVFESSDESDLEMSSSADHGNGTSTSRAISRITKETAHGTTCGSHPFCHSETEHNKASTAATAAHTLPTTGQMAMLTRHEHQGGKTASPHDACAQCGPDHFGTLISISAEGSPRHEDIERPDPPHQRYCVEHWSMTLHNPTPASATDDGRDAEVLAEPEAKSATHGKK